MLRDPFYDGNVKTERGIESMSIITLGFHSLSSQLLFNSPLHILHYICFTHLFQIFHI